MAEKKIDPIRPTDDEAIRLGKTLIRTARFGALGVLDPETGTPFVSRVALATDYDSTPILLISTLAHHTRALHADPRCSLLVGEPGKGDPLAHPRITLTCTAQAVERGTDARDRLAGRYLRRNPKAQLYAGFADFGYYRLEISGAALNGGFGKAYHLGASDLLVPQADSARFARFEEVALKVLNGQHQAELSGLAVSNPKRPPGQISGLDPDGFDYLSGDTARRLFFSEPLLQCKKSEHLVSAVLSRLIEKV